VADQRTTLGEIIRSQRALNALSMRRFADMVGILRWPTRRPGLRSARPVRR
jgi:hypothetical protein